MKYVFLHRLNKISGVFLALLLNLSINAQTQMDLPVTFEDATVAYGLIGFGGADSSTIVTDHPSNGSTTGVRVYKSATAQLWAGTTVTDAIGSGFLTPIAFSAGSTVITVSVWSPDAGIPIRLKAEDHTNPTISVETEAVTTMANAWETLTFDFSNHVSGTATINFANTYNKVSIFFNFGTDGATAGAKTYYFDDLAFVPGAPPALTQMDLPVTFEDATVNYSLIGFGGADSSVVTVDPMNGANTVVRVHKNGGAQTWAGTTITDSLNQGFISAIPFAVGATSMTIKVLSPDAGIPVRLKVEDHTNPGISVETEVLTTVANAWETLTFDFSNHATGTAAINFSNSYNKASIFFNFGTDGATAGAKTYHFDDVEFVIPTGPVLSQMDLPVTFDDPTVNYSYLGFGGAEASTLEADPLNPTNSVTKVIKNGTAQLWAGTTVTDSSGIGFLTAIPFAAGSTSISVRVLSPDAGIPVRLKVEDHTNPGISVETEALTTVANTWDTLIFDFSNQVPTTPALNFSFTYNKASIFFNFGTDGATAGSKTYYFDDMIFVAATPTLTQMDLPVTFDDPNVNYSFVGFGGAEASTLEVDPANGSNTVAKVIKNGTAQTWAGTTVTDSSNAGFISAIPFATGASYMTVKVYSPDAGIPVRLKVEDYTNPGISVETEAITSVANAWETLVFDFSNQASGTAAINFANSYNKASIFFNFGTDGATAGTKTYYFDDLEYAATPPLSQMNLPVSFEDPTVNYSFIGFGGAEASSLVTDPTNASNSVAEVNKSATAQTWAGTTVTDSTNAGFLSAIPFAAGATSMSVKVYSPDAGIPVRLKVEDHTNPGISVETEALTTAANTWETLTFDFSNHAIGTAAINFANSYNKASIFFNFGTDGATAGAKTYYFDDMDFVIATPALTQMDLPVTFDDPTVNYSFVGFGGAEASSLATDPLNASNLVAEVIKNATAQTWAGTTVTDSANAGFISAIPFAAGASFMIVEVYSPDAGIPVRLKVEDHTNPGISVETEVMTSVANAWETLVFDFSNQVAGTPAINFANTYDKASIFFNFGTDGATAGAKTYYFDNMEYAAAAPLTQMNLPVTFEDPTVNYSFIGFGGAEASSLVTDPVNATNSVAEVIKNATAQTWAGTTVTDSTNAGFLATIPFAVGSTSMTVKVYSPDAGIPVRLKVEDHTNPGISVETEAITTAANTWETLTFDFSNHATGTAALNLANSYNKASIFFNFGTDGATAGAKTYYFDDMEFVTTPLATDLNITAMIEGYYIPGTGLMQSVIANSQFLPPTLECDSLTVELHDATSTLSVPVIAETFTGVLATDGTMSCTFPGTINGNSYYIVLKHRNALETWSTNPVLMGLTTAYDFTVLANVFGNNAKLVNPGVYALFSGNLNGDGFIDVGDYPVWETAANGFAFGYEDTDLTGDGLVDLSDYTIWEGNSNAFVFVFAPF